MVGVPTIFFWRIFMLTKDKAQLIALATNYDLKDLIDNLVDYLESNADNFSDLGMNHVAKKYSQHANILLTTSYKLKQ